MGELRALAVTVVHVLVPEGIDDPARPSGGNVFDRRVCRGLAALGWVVQERPVPGSWAAPDEVARATLVSTLSAIRDGALVLLDGLIASTAPEALVPRRDGCASSSWCTLHWATACRGRRFPTPQPESALC